MRRQSRWVWAACALGVVASSSACSTSEPGGARGAAGSVGAAGAAGSNAGAGATGSGGSTGTSGSSGGAMAGTTGAAGSGASGASAAGTTGSAGSTDGGAPPDGAAGTGGGATIDGGVRLKTGELIDGTFFYLALDDGSLHMYRQGTWEEVGTWTGLPVKDGVRGSDADPETGILYFTHGAAGPGHGAVTPNGGLLAWSLLTNSQVFNVAFDHGVDQPAYGQGLVYVPAGEFATNTTWYYVKASDGSQVGTEAGGLGPHDTLFRNSHRYYGGTQDTYLYVLGLPIQKVGPSPSAKVGVRPFTINAAETRAYITWSGFRGFSVGDLTTGKLLSTQSFGVACTLAAPSHGITLSPDGKEIYVMDTCVNQLRVYDSSDQPQLRATIDLAHQILGGVEQPCAWDCDKDGWLLHSRNGKYVYVGNSGDIIDTATRKPSAYLPTLANGRHGFLEMIWSKGVVVDTSTHVGLGY